MSTHDINAGKPQNEWLIPAGEVVELYGKSYMVVKDIDSDGCDDCAFDDSGKCINAPKCYARERGAIGGDAIHFVEVE